MNKQSLDEIRRLYRFAHIGQINTAILHELANHLTVLTLDIEDMEERLPRASADRIRHSIESINYLIHRVGVQLSSGQVSKNFDVLSCVQESILALEYRAQMVNVQLRLHAKKIGSLLLPGNALGLEQALRVVITNAIDAYESGGRQVVEIGVSEMANKVMISVTDYGIGILGSDRAVRIFKPHYSTKANGMGIGLFLAKEIIETHFKGLIWLDPDVSRTTFIIELPKCGRKVRAA